MQLLTPLVTNGTEALTCIFITFISYFCTKWFKYTGMIFFHNNISSTNHITLKDRFYVYFTKRGRPQIFLGVLPGKELSRLKIFGLFENCKFLKFLKPSTLYISDDFWWFFSEFSEVLQFKSYTDALISTRT